MTLSRRDWLTIAGKLAGEAKNVSARVLARRIREQCAGESLAGEATLSLSERDEQWIRIVAREVGLSLGEGVAP